MAAVGLCLFSTWPMPTLLLFTVLGLVGLSSNPVLINLAVGYGGHAPTLASAMATSMFNLGTAITSLALIGRLGSLAPLIVGAVFAMLVFVPLTLLVILEHRTPSRRGHLDVRSPPMTDQGPSAPPS